MTSRMVRKRRAQAGGRAVIDKQPPQSCPRCNRPMDKKTWHGYLGHLGIHGLADKYFDGDFQAAQKRLRENGRARSDPFPGNGAWKPYRPIQQYPPEELPF